MATPTSYSLHEVEEDFGLNQGLLGLGGQVETCRAHQSGIILAEIVVDIEAPHEDASDCNNPEGAPNNPPQAPLGQALSRSLNPASTVDELCPASFLPSPAGLNSKNYVTLHVRERTVTDRTRADLHLSM